MEKRRQDMTAKAVGGDALRRLARLIEGRRATLTVRTSLEGGSPAVEAVEAQTRHLADLGGGHEVKAYPLHAPAVAHVVQAMRDYAMMDDVRTALDDPRSCIISHASPDGESLEHMLVYPLADEGLERSLYVFVVASEADYGDDGQYARMFADGEVTLEIGLPPEYRLADYEVAAMRPLGRRRVQSLVLALVEHGAKAPSARRMADAMRVDMLSPRQIRPIRHAVLPNSCVRMGRWRKGVNWDFAAKVADWKGDTEQP